MYRLQFPSKFISDHLRLGVYQIKIRFPTWTLASLWQRSPIIPGIVVEIFTVAKQYAATTCAPLLISITWLWRYYCGACKMKHVNNVNSIQRTRRAIVSFMLFITSFRKIIRILLLDLFFGQCKNIRNPMEKWSSQNRTSWIGFAALAKGQIPDASIVQ